MSKQCQRVMWVAVLALSVSVAGRVTAGSLDPTNAPGPTMHTLEEIYDKVSWISTDVVSVVVQTNVYQTFESGVPKTGQTTSYAMGDDGDTEKGIAWPVPRFTDNANGTVTDNLTGLIWAKDAELLGSLTWSNALTACGTLANGVGGLTDGSVAGDWRLPNLRELQSLIDYGQGYPCLPSGHPFTPDDPEFGIAGEYWSSSTILANAGAAWCVNLTYGRLNEFAKTSAHNVWAVRGEE